MKLYAARRAPAVRCWLIVMTLVQCLPGLTVAQESAPSRAPSATQNRPNLLLLTLDTTRNDHIGPRDFETSNIGSDSASAQSSTLTPHLDRLAASGRRFSRCDASSPLTLPSHASLLTGLYPPRHGVRDNGGFVLDRSVLSVAESLRDAGYDTAAVLSASVLARGYGLARGFVSYDDDLARGWSKAAPVAERSASTTLELALERLPELKAPFFLWIHFFDPHAPYESYGAREGYGAEISRMDEAIGRLLDELPPRTVVVAVGDHGEMLGEHGESEHGLLPFAGARRVPLILAGEGIASGRDVEALVRTVDVAPTLLELAGVDVAERIDGESLLPLLEVESAASRLSYWESFYPFRAFRWYPLRALSDGSLLYIEAPEPTLYDTHERPLAADEGRLRRWRGRLESLLSAAGETLHAELAPSAPLARTQADQLASLGYAAGVSGGSIHTDLPDPRALTAEAELLRRAAGQLKAKTCDGLLLQLRPLLERQPENPAARLLAGRCDLVRGDSRGALVHFRAAGDSPLALGYLADALVALGRREEASKALRLSLDQDPAGSGAAAQLARLLRSARLVDEAREVTERAIEAGAGAAEVYFERAQALHATGHKAAALDDFVEAMRRAPGQSAPAANAARLARELGRLVRATELYEVWLRLAPGERNAWRELAAVYERLARPDDARRCYRRALALESEIWRRKQLEKKIRELDG